MSLFGNFRDFLESVDEKANKTSETIAAASGNNPDHHGERSLASKATFGDHMNSATPSTTFPSIAPSASASASKTLFPTAPPLTSVRSSAAPTPSAAVKSSASSGDLPTSVDRPMPAHVVRNEENQKMLGELRNTVDLLQQDKEQLRYELREVENQLTSLQSRHAATLREVQQLKNTASEKETELQHLNYVVSTRDATAQELREEVAQHKARIKMLMETTMNTNEKERIAAASISGTSLPSNDGLTELETKCENTMVQLERETFAHNQTKSNLELLRNTMQELKAHYSKETTKAEEVHEALRQELSALRAQYEEEVRAHCTTKTELQKARRSAALVGAQQQHSGGECASSPAAVGDGAVNLLLHDIQTALEKKRTECDALQHRLTACMGKLRDAEVKYTTLLQSQRCGGGVAAGGDTANGTTNNHNNGSVEVEMPPMPLEIESRFFEDLSKKGWLGQRAINVASRLNFWSLRAGRYLRKNTDLRVFIMLYVILLHVWVFVALSAAELHHG